VDAFMINILQGTAQALVVVAIITLVVSTYPPSRRWLQAFRVLPQKIDQCDARIDLLESKVYTRNRLLTQIQSIQEQSLSLQKDMRNQLSAVHNFHQQTTNLLDTCLSN
jgi:hypothetical protein